MHGAGGQLGEMNGEQLKVVSLAGSHTNFMLRLIAQGAPHESSVCSVGGRLNLELVDQRDPALARYARQGLQWEVLSRQVAEQWPSFLDLVQSAMNATLQKQESEMQLLRRVHGMVASAQSPDFQKIKTAALASKPPCSGSLPGIYLFALKFLGGALQTQHVVRHLRILNVMLYIYIFIYII